MEETIETSINLETQNELVVAPVEIETEVASEGQNAPTTTLSSKSVTSMPQRGRRNSTLFAATKASTYKVRSRSCDSLADKKSKTVCKKLTKPVSPNLRVAKRSFNAGRPLPPSSDALEALRVDEAVRQEKVRIMKAKKAFQRVKVNLAQAIKHSAVRSTKQLTIPSTPKSRLTKRLGLKKCSIVGLEKEPEPVKKEVEHTGPRGLTVAEPFHFATDARITTVVKESVPTAGEALAKYFLDPRSHDAPETACKHLTEAKSPHFRTDARSKSGSHPAPMSSEEREKLMMEEISQHPFKAKPVDLKVLNGEVETARVVTKPLTQFHEFDLKTNQRAAERKGSESSEATASFAFKALPMPQFHAPVSPKIARANFKPTVAISPKLSGGRRSSIAPVHRQRAHHSVVEQQKAQDKAKLEKLLHSAEPLRLTEPKEFSLQSDARGLAYKAALEEKIRRENEAAEAARMVKANPVPGNLDKPFQVKPSDKELTEVEEFRLRSNDRHHISEIKFQQEIREEEERLRQEFKALPLPKTTYKPDFTVEPDERSLVVPMEVALESAVRACKRKEFDDMVLANKKEAERQKEEEERRLVDKENQELKQMRRRSVDEGGLLFVAKPISTLDQYPTKTPKAIPLTEPKSPFLRTKVRASHRLSVDESLDNITAF